MPEITCDKCGSHTNTALCDHIDRMDGKADRCYLKWVDGKWEKGCAYEEADEYTKPYIDKMLKEQEDKEDEPDAEDKAAAIAMMKQELRDRGLKAEEDMNKKQRKRRRK